MDYENCEHDFTFTEDICSKCGMEFMTQYNIKEENIRNCSSIQKKSEDLFKVLSELNYPSDVIQKARSNKEKQQALECIKIRNDRKNVFILMLRAYMDLQIYTCDEKKLGKDLKLDRKSINACIKKTNGVSLEPSKYQQPNYPNIIIIPPVVYIESYVSLFLLDKSHVKPLEEKSEEIINKNDNLLSRVPNILACAIIKKYCEKNKIVLKSISTIAKINESLLKLYLNEISEFF